MTDSSQFSPRVSDAQQAGAHPAKVVVLASGSGTLLQALLDCTDPGFCVVAVGSDLRHCGALDRAAQAGIDTFTVGVNEYLDRSAWNAALAQLCLDADADLVVLAGFMKLVGPAFLAALPGRVINAHPSLLPAFPGMHAPADALAHGVKLSGCTIFIVDEGVDAGPILAQRAVPVFDDDDVPSLHERIKVAERALLVEVVAAMASRGWDVNQRKVSIR
ncbi:phosphoribosylglycinamide formyltransferase [Nakamurella antarctica]|uniref:Phosphoribosylglycinamide formyltransferase n=1 Tax=Nakamurella antarctica TaxID=1902245 RepID=A0A3G8ZYF2_9ACTN|nr:phosphoribosylglycinamide formyltransferase [Nakamurella antarctica]AZI58611.1 phosphoribosylglycinamide formyltransferase [Nakamurella antarctica]